MSDGRRVIAAPSPELLQQAWGLSGVRVGESFGGRFARRVFVIHSDQGTFAAKVNDEPPPAQDAARELAVLDHLADRGYAHAPALQHTLGGDRLVHTGTRSVTLLEHVPGHFDPDGPPPPDTWAALGRATAALNAHTDYPDTSRQSFVDVVPDQLRDKVRGHPIESPFLSLLDRIEPLRHSSQRALVHGEVNLANSGHRADGTVVLLDWDGTGTGPVALDYGYPLITQFIDQFDCTFHQRAAEAFYGSYADEGGMVDVDLAFLAALFEAMFYMWFFNADGRWARIEWAVTHERELRAVIERASTR